MQTDIYTPSLACALASLRLHRSPAPSSAPPPPVRPARSFCGRLASARALLAGRVLPRCRCRRCRSCCSSRRCSGSLNRLPSPLFSNNTKGPVPSGHLYLYNMYIVRLRFAMSPSLRPVLDPLGRCVGRVRQSSKNAAVAAATARGIKYTPADDLPAAAYLRGVRSPTTPRDPLPTALGRQRRAAIGPVVPRPCTARLECSSFVNSVLDAKRLLNNIISHRALL